MKDGLPSAPSFAATTPVTVTVTPFPLLGSFLLLLGNLLLLLLNVHQLGLNTSKLQSRELLPSQNFIYLARPRGGRPQGADPHPSFLYARDGR